jgi:probable phosphoglycerate mutase
VGHRSGVRPLTTSPPEPGRRPAPGRSPEPARPLVPDGLDATLVLLRHGETDYIVDGRFQGQAEATLTDLGRRQAALAGARLARPDRSPALPIPATRPMAIVHSPLRRAAETAALVATSMAAATGPGEPPTPRPDPGFTEIGQGAWEGMAHDEIAVRYADVLAGWRRRPTEVWAPGGESPMAVQTRLRPSLAALLDALAAGRPPGSLDRSQVPGYRGTALASDRPWALIVGHDGVFKVLLLTILDLPIERFWAFTMALCGLTVLELRAGRPVLVAHNVTEHLAPLEVDEARAEAEAAERSRSGAL